MTQCKHDTSGNKCWCNPDREDYRDAATVRRATLLEVAALCRRRGEDIFIEMGRMSVADWEKSKVDCTTYEYACNRLAQELERMAGN